MSDRRIRIATIAAVGLLGLATSGCVSNGAFKDRNAMTDARIDALQDTKNEYDRRNTILDAKLRAIESSTAPSASMEDRVNRNTAALERANARIVELEKTLRDRTDSLTKENAALRELIRQESEDLAREIDAVKAGK